MSYAPPIDVPVAPIVSHISEEEDKVRSAAGNVDVVHIDDDDDEDDGAV